MTNPEQPTREERLALVELLDDRALEIGPEIYHGSTLKAADAILAAGYRRGPVASNWRTDERVKDLRERAAIATGVPHPSAAQQYRFSPHALEVLLDAVAAASSPSPGGPEKIVWQIVRGLGDAPLKHFSCYDQPCSHPRAEHENVVASLMCAALGFDALHPPAQPGEKT
jgi:hypothetical protein